MFSYYAGKTWCETEEDLKNEQTNKQEQELDSAPAGNLAIYEKSQKGEMLHIWAQCNKSAYSNRNTNAHNATIQPIVPYAINAAVLYLG